MSTAQIIFAVIGLALTLALAVIGYFMKELDGKFSALSRTVERHNDEDDVRFKDLQRMDEDIRKDMVEKRHAFRAEMREAFAAVADREEKLEERLRNEIQRTTK